MSSAIAGNKHRLFRVVTGLGIVLLAAVFAVLVLAGDLWLSGNIHVVERGQLYRSGQLSAAQLSATINRYGIKSVINLRGASRDQAWYADELATSAAFDVKHVDLALSANNDPEAAKLASLIDWFQHLPRPILVHCEAGADRSGLAAALYELTIARKSRQDAAEQLSLRFGHFPWLLSRTGAMDRAFAQFADHYEGKVQAAATNQR